MRTVLIAALAAASLVPALPATAQHYQDRSYQERGDDRRDYRGDDRNDYRGDGQRDYRNYDYNHPPRGGYFADQYYRSGSQYRERRLGRNDRIYRGRNGRYYCRRNDGTTGLIVGGVAGGLLGNTIAGGGSRLLGTLIGGTGGALLGQSIDRGDVRCR